MTPARDVHEWLLRPIRFVKIKCVLLRLAIVRDQALVVATADAAFVSPVAGEIGQVPDERAPDKWTGFHLRPGFLVEQRLPFLRMPLAVVARLARMLFVLQHVCSSAV